MVTLWFGGERQRLGLLGVSGGGRGGRRQGGGGRGRGVQHAAVRGRRAVDHLLLREVLHTGLLIPRRVICSQERRKLRSTHRTRSTLYYTVIHYSITVISRLHNAQPYSLIVSMVTADVINGDVFSQDI